MGKPIFYKIKNDKDFSCPLCNTTMVLRNISYTYLNEYGKPNNILFESYGSQRLICPNCGLDMTGQLEIQTDESKNDGSKKYRLINIDSSRSNPIINYNNIDYNGFFKKEGENNE